ncbi:MAG: PKD domain-containing protein [Candidatus Peribacteraceae bacterium]|jgi:PKD repeat protein
MPALPTPPQKATSAVDGVMKPATVAAANKAAPVPVDTAVRRQKQMLVTLGGLLYGAYILWCFALMAMLPSTDPALVSLTKVGVLTVAFGGGVLLIIGFILLQRVSRPQLSTYARRKGLLRLLFTFVPGLLISVAVPFVILRQTPLPIDIVSPKDVKDLIAPVPVTFSMERSVELLKQLGRVPIKYEWFTDNSGKLTETTVSPQTTAVFKRAGVYSIGVRLTLDDGTMRRVTRSLLIQEEVFSVTPEPVVVKKVVQFSIAHLLSDPKQLTQVQWDFDGNGVTDETTQKAVIDHIFYAVDTYNVTALIELQNQTQKTYKRKVTVQSPPPLPFPLTLKTDLKKLIGPAPFGVVFTVETDEPLEELYWSFGDGEQQTGVELRRAGHTFKTPGTYGVVLRARSSSGAKLAAEVTSVVRVTPELNISDLQLEGSPEMKNNTVSGEMPLNVELTPKTSQPLIQFSWDYPEDITASVDGTTFKGIFRKQGKFHVTLIAEDPSGSSRRTQIIIDVLPPAAEPVIDMQPEGGMAPLRVVFDASQTFIPEGEKIAGYKWFFGDEGNGGNDAVTGGSRVEHTYEKAGEYKVKLVLVTSLGKEYTTERTLIVRRPVLSACATASRLTLAAGGSVKLDASCSTGSPAGYLWDIRRSDRPNFIVGQSDKEEYVHVFDQAGEYTVTLTIEDGDGYQDSRTLTMMVTP